MTSELGERVRALRIGAGMSQSALAGGRFSKEYVSQIERGRTRPSAEALEWLAGRLGVDVAALGVVDGVAVRERAEVSLARAEALTEAGRDREALAEFVRLRPLVEQAGSPELDLRSRAGEGWARTRLGDEGALDLLLEARALAERSTFSGLDRAHVLFRLGVCRYRRGSVATALGLLTEALALADSSGLPCERLRAEILSWRSRCQRRRRSLDDARADAEGALALAEEAADSRRGAEVALEAASTAEAQGQWRIARAYAERARALYGELNADAGVGRALTDLAGLVADRDPEQGAALLERSSCVALRGGHRAEAARALRSLAELRLAAGDAERAEADARRALEAVAAVVDAAGERGAASLVLGRALAEQDRLDEAAAALADADAAFEQEGSLRDRASAWLAQGELAERAGDQPGAARLYRRAAEALQDFRF